MEDGFSGEEDIEEGAVEILDEVVEVNELTELPDVDLDDVDDDEKGKSDEPYRDEDGRSGLPFKYGFDGRLYGVAGAVGGEVGVGVVDGVSSSK